MCTYERRVKARHEVILDAESLGAEVVESIVPPIAQGRDVSGPAHRTRSATCAQRRVSFANTSIGEIEEDSGDDSSDDDRVEDEDYRIEHRSGKGTTSTDGEDNDDVVVGS